MQCPERLGKLVTHTVHSGFPGKGNSLGLRSSLLALSSAGLEDGMMQARLNC